MNSTWNRLDQFIDKVHIFKTHFASLDIRQDHSKHKLAVETILKQQGAIQEDLAELDRSEMLRLAIEKGFKTGSQGF